MWRSRTFLPAVKVKPVLQATVSLTEKFRFPDTLRAAQAGAKSGRCLPESAVFSFG